MALGSIQANIQTWKTPTLTAKNNTGSASTKVNTTPPKIKKGDSMTSQHVLEAGTSGQSVQSWVKPRVATLVNTMIQTKSRSSYEKAKTELTSIADALHQQYTDGSEIMSEDAIKLNADMQQILQAVDKHHFSTTSNSSLKQEISGVSKRSGYHKYEDATDINKYVKKNWLGKTILRQGTLDRLNKLDDLISTAIDEGSRLDGGSEISSYLDEYSTILTTLNTAVENGKFNRQSDLDAIQKAQSHFDSVSSLSYQAPDTSTSDAAMKTALDTITASINDSLGKQSSTVDLPSNLTVSGIRSYVLEGASEPLVSRNQIQELVENEMSRSDSDVVNQLVDEIQAAITEGLSTLDMDAIRKDLQPDTKQSVDRLTTLVEHSWQLDGLEQYYMQLQELAVNTSDFSTEIEALTEKAQTKINMLSGRANIPIVQAAVVDTDSKVSAMEGFSDAYASIQDVKAQTSIHSGETLVDLDTVKGLLDTVEGDLNAPGTRRAIGVKLLEMKTGRDLSDASLSDVVDTLVAEIQNQGVQGSIVDPLGEFIIDMFKDDVGYEVSSASVDTVFSSKSTEIEGMAAPHVDTLFKNDDARFPGFNRLGTNLLALNSMFPNQPSIQKGLQDLSTKATACSELAKENKILMKNDVDRGLVSDIQSLDFVNTVKVSQFFRRDSIDPSTITTQSGGQASLNTSIPTFLGVFDLKAQLYSDSGNKTEFDTQKQVIRDCVDMVKEECRTFNIQDPLYERDDAFRVYFV